MTKELLWVAKCNYVRSNGRVCRYYAQTIENHHPRCFKHHKKVLQETLAKENAKAEKQKAQKKKDKIQADQNRADVYWNDVAEARRKAPIAGPNFQTSYEREEEAHKTQVAKTQALLQKEIEADHRYGTSRHSGGTSQQTVDGMKRLSPTVPEDFIRQHAEGCDCPVCEKAKDISVGPRRNVVEFTRVPGTDAQIIFLECGHSFRAAVGGNSRRRRCYRCREIRQSQPSETKTGPWKLVWAHGRGATVNNSFYKLECGHMGWFKETPFILKSKTKCMECHHEQTKKEQVSGASALAAGVLTRGLRGITPPGQRLLAQGPGVWAPDASRGLS